MKGFLLDTNVLSEFSRRGTADVSVRRWLTDAKDLSVHTSVLAIAEIRQGIELLDPGKRRSELEQWIEQELISGFGDRILPITKAVAERWAVSSAQLKRQGISLPVIDGLIAATALEHKLVIVTRNTKDFAHVGGSPL